MEQTAEGEANRIQASTWTTGETMTQTFFACTDCMCWIGAVMLLRGL